MRCGGGDGCCALCPQTTPLIPSSSSSSSSSSSRPPPPSFLLSQIPNSRLFVRSRGNSVKSPPMLLGKRPRPPMRRTTSMSGINPPPDIITDGQDPSKETNKASVLIIEEHSHDVPNLVPMASPRSGYSSRAAVGGAFGLGYDCDGGHPEMAYFLETCGLCKRRLFPGQDIYMYRGDTAFCSLECREQLMKQDERKAKHGQHSPRDGFDRMD